MLSIQKKFENCSIYYGTKLHKLISLKLIFSSLTT